MSDVILALIRNILHLKNIIYSDPLSAPYRSINHIYLLFIFIYKGSNLPRARQAQALARAHTTP